MECSYTPEIGVELSEWGRPSVETGRICTDNVKLAEGHKDIKSSLQLESRPNARRGRQRQDGEDEAGQVRYEQEDGGWWDLYLRAGTYSTRVD